MIEVDVPDREITRLLPRDVCNEIIRQAFAAEGFQLRDPRTLRYRPHIEEAPEQIILHIEQPVKAELRGKWTQPQLTTMVFDFADLTLQLAEDRQWPLIPLAQQYSESVPQESASSPSSLFDAVPGSPHPQQPTPPPTYPRPREARSILLDD